MTSQIFMPTFLYIKQHSITGMLYFGKTIKNPEKYLGSGKYWSRHIKAHGKKHVVTLWYCLFLQETDCTEFALQFSKNQDIVKSNNWANVIPENGISGAVAGTKRGPSWNAGLSKETDNRLLEMGAKTSKTKKGKPTWNSGLKGTNDPRTKNNAEKSAASRKRNNKPSLPAWNKGVPVSNELKLKISNSMSGKLFFNDGTINKRFLIDDVPSGWTRGKIKKKPL